MNTSIKPPCDYTRLDYRYRQHHIRYEAFVKAMPRKLVCQECGGCGYFEEIVCEYGGPKYDCEYCEGTGYMTPWLRGVWLRFKREVSRERL